MQKQLKFIISSEQIVPLSLNDIVFDRPSLSLASCEPHTVLRYLKFYRIDRADIVFYLRTSRH